MKTHNLTTVMGFELRRTLGKPFYWLATLSLPLLLLVIMVLSGLSGNAAATSLDSNETFKFTYVDPGSHVVESVAAQLGGRVSSDEAADLSAVKAGKLDLLIVFANDPLLETNHVYGKDIGLMKSVAYHEIANRLLQESAKSQIGKADALKRVTAKAPTEVTRYLTNGTVAPGFIDTVMPGLFLVLFYLSIIMLGQQMMNITMEEKENRVSEMILTTMNPTTLLVGKILSVIIASICQVVVLSSLGFIGVGFAQKSAVIPPEIAATVGQISFPIIPMLIGFLLYAGGFLVFTGALVCVGAVMPTAKEAGNIFGFVLLTMFIPIYVWGIVIAEPHGWLSQLMTFFPLTAPITALFRNALGSLYTWEVLVTLGLLFATATGLLLLGGRLFKTGSLSYTSRLNIKKALGFK